VRCISLLYLLLQLLLMRLHFQDEKPVVFKSGTRAKKVFKLFDHDRDKFLNRAEFAAGVVDFISQPELAAQITPQQIDALWDETDLNKDDKISWAEFLFRFCGGPDPRLAGGKKEKKQSLMLQTPRKKEVPQGKAAQLLADCRNVLEALYDGGKPRYKEVDLSKSKALTQPLLKKMLGQILAEEKAEAKEEKRAVEPWAAKCIASGAAADQKVVDRFFTTLKPPGSGSSATLDLSPFFEQLKLRPSTKPVPAGKGKSKKKKDASKSSGPQGQRTCSLRIQRMRASGCGTPPGRLTRDLRAGKPCCEKGLLLTLALFFFPPHLCRSDWPQPTC